MHITDLPIEILEKIIYYCDYKSLINFGRVYNIVSKIYEKYDIDSLSTYIGIIKFSINTIQIHAAVPNIILDHNDSDDSENDSDDDEGQNMIHINKNITKYIITRDPKQLKSFFLKYLDIIKLNVDITKIRCYFKPISCNEAIRINNIDELGEFTKCVYNYSSDLNDYIFTDYVGGFHNISIPLYKMLEEDNIYHQNAFMSELDTLCEHNCKKITKIIHYIGKNKLCKNIKLFKVIIKEVDNYNYDQNTNLYLSGVRIIFMDDILKDTKIGDFIKKDIEELTFEFRLNYPFIENQKAFYSLKTIHMNRQYVL